ncbi:MAG TPA: twin transmembrane helix small protein [Usitatibacter sp.]|nr:twin transmembrane helix small protein [Usitatibacter sp.]
MDLFHWIVLAAIGATVFALGSGVFAMVKDGEIRHQDSATWMNWRVAFQGVAVLLVLAAAYAEG